MTRARATSTGSEATCPGCGGTDVRRRAALEDRLFRTTAERFALHGCGGCGLRFLWPAPPPEELARYYPDGYWTGPAGHAEGRNGGARPGLHAALTAAYRRTVLFDHVRFVRRVLRERRARGAGTELLDIGCGDGSLLAAFGASPGIGMDLSAAALVALRARGLAGVCGDPLAPPFPDRSFGVVTMFHFLEHVTPPQPVLAAVRRLLRPDGDLVVQVPNRRSWQARLLGRRWAGLDAPRHLVDYCDRTLRATLERAGFAVVRATHFSLRDNPTTLANSLVPGLYPPARVARGGRRAGVAALAADLAYLGVTAAVTPFTLLESACGRGAAIMMQARPA